MTGAGDLTHRLVETNGIRIHAVEAGTGPLVVLVHGFPESWYSWRHQIPVLAAAGYRVVAIDVRGYGRSSKPVAVDAYRMLMHVADNVGLVSALGEEEAVIIGHDWGAPIAANSALLRPDLFSAVALLSVPYSPRGISRPTDAFRAMTAGGGDEFYISYFQEPGRAEREIETDVRNWLLGFYIGASADSMGANIATVPAGGQLRDRFTLPDTLPAWLTEADLDYYAAEFEHGGFAGPLNRYRNVDRDFDDLATWAFRPIEVPSLFVGGDRDGPTIWGAAAIARFDDNLPALHGSHILEHCGHWVQQEQPARVNELLLDFLAAVRPR